MLSRISASLPSAFHTPVTDLVRSSIQHKNLRKMTTPALLTGPGSDKLLQYDCAAAGACSRETPLVPDDEIAELLKAVPSWKKSADGIKITKAFTAKNFMAAMKFFNNMASVAEAEGHHPDIHLTNYRDVAVDLTTHAAGGLTMLDFVMAAKIDRIDIDYSPKWLKQAQESMALAGKQH